MRMIKAVIKWACFLFTTAALLVMFTPLANWLAGPLIVKEDVFRKADIIAVLGGGAYPNGALGSASNERLIKGLTLLHEGKADRVLFAGGSIVDIGSKLGHTVMGLAPDRKGVAEASLMKDAAIGLGTPSSACVSEAWSLNTFENLSNLKAYMEKERLTTVAVVTSPLHMKRAVFVARRLGLDYRAAPAADYTEYKTSPIARIKLIREAGWEYGALVLYRLYGYI